MVSRKIVGLLLILLAAAVVRPGEPAAAQEIIPAVIGGAAGLAAGGYVAIGIVTFQARRGRYLYSSEDALGWHATPILVGPGVGFLIGILDPERLRRTILGGAAGGMVGTGVGWLTGLYFWPPPEGKWAGGVIGGAAGLLAGSLVGVLWPQATEDQPPDAASESRGVPIGVTISF